MKSRRHYPYPSRDLDTPSGVTNITDAFKNHQSDGLPATPWSQTLLSASRAIRGLPTEILRPTSPFVPDTKKKFSSLNIPFGFVLNPLPNCTIPQFDRTQCDELLRCEKCRAFGSHFAHITGPDEWTCPICGRENYVIDPGVNLTSAPELHHYIYELKASSTFQHFKAAGMRFVLCIDNSAESWSAGFAPQVLVAIQSGLPQMPDKCELGIITFDQAVSVYSHAHKKWFIVPDTEGVCLPFGADALFTKDKVEVCAIIEGLMASPSRKPGHCIGSACQMAGRLTEMRGAIVLVFAYGLPTVGQSKLEPRECAKTVGTTDEAQIMTFADGDEFYRMLPVTMVECAASMHFFIGGNGFVDIATTGGPLRRLAVVSLFSHHSTTV
jgi:hypothetical protein